MYPEFLMSTFRLGSRATLLAAAMLCLVAAAACGSSSPSTPARSTRTLIDLTATGGHVDGGVRRKEVALGSTVTVRVTSDVAEEIHVHGYDRKQDLQPGKPGEVTFTADIPGVFEVELERAGHKLVELAVS